MSEDLRLRALPPSQKRQLLQATLARRQQAGAAIVNATVRRDGWIVPLTSRPAARRRVVCFPHGAAGPSAFRGWPDLLPPDLEAFAVQLPGREARADEPFVTDLDRAAQAIADALDPLLDRPYVFYGHSLGAAIAFATAAALRARGAPLPAHLVVAAAPPPGHHPSMPSAEDAWRDYHEFSEGVDMSQLVSGGRGSAALEERARADRTLLAGWANRRDEPLEVPITVLHGREDRTQAASTLAAWAAHTRSAFELRIVPGPHLFHLANPRLTAEAVARAAGSGPARSGIGAPAEPQPASDGLGISLFFFSATEEDADRDKYRLFDAAVQFAERSGFEAVWIPERHFHPVGGLFPNPSVLAAAVAASTRRLRIRSGSVVLPMHDPLRVAEEWALVDNLSGGRVDMGVVPGWNPNDYVLAPAAYANRWPEVFERLDIVRRLWRGDAVLRTNGHGDEVPTRVHPRPIQRELPVWIATSANDQSFMRAGELGLNVLTALLIQSVDEFAGRVRLYRDARARAGHDPAGGRVTLMVHTCIGESDAQVRGVVREPFLAYMQTVQSLWKDTVDALRTETAVAQDRLLDMVFERYFQKSTLFGSLETCLARARDFELAGATELACMVDFGLSDDDGMASLGWLARLREVLATRRSPAVAS
jgi:natural product biosynthesis luciferase-like monooxygenase protein